MSKAKKPTAVKQLKEVLARISELEAKLADRDAEIVKLSKNLDNEKAAKDRWFAARQEADAEIEQVHILLDSMPNAIARHIEGEYGAKTIIKPMTRLAAWLATRG